jgi:XTP/dITP diphosphohydrolase
MTQQDESGIQQPTQDAPGRPLPAAQPHPELDQLVAVLEQLRAPGGCVWDAEQSHESLVRYLVEETYELVEAIESGDRDDLIEELGDVLYQVIFHSDIAAHTPGEEFTIEDVAAHMTAKMVGRHPHVYGELAGDPAATTAADVNARWDELKKLEKPSRTSVLDGVPQGMPALALADKLLGKATKLGMSGSELSGNGAASGSSELDSEQALGEALLATVAAAHEQGLDAERALRGALRDLQARMREQETSTPSKSP